MSEQTQDADIHVALQRMRSEFIVRLPERVDELRAQLAALERAEPQALETLHRGAHSLVGAAGVHQLLEVSAAARALERLLAAQPLDKPVGVAVHVALRDALELLARAAENPVVSQALQVPRARAAMPRIMVVDDDAEQVNWLRSVLMPAGYIVEAFTSLDAFRAACARDEQPAAVFMDMVFPEGDDAGARAIREVKAKSLGGLPIIFVSVRQDMAARLMAYRAGATRYLSKPLTREAILHVLGETSRQAPERPYRVLLVDDDPEPLQVHATVLRQAGMEVLALSDPLRVMAELEHFAAEALVLDMYMPQCSGPELAAVLGDEPRFAEIPVIYLSAETNISLQLVALDRGGDHFLTKPVEPRHLIATVNLHARRLRRMREQRQALEELTYEREREHAAVDAHAIVSTTDAQGNILYANDRFCQISGYSREELIGRNHRLIKSAEHSPELYASMWETIAGGRIWQGEVCNRAKDGHLYWVESTIVPFLDQNGLPYRYVSIRTDVSRLKKTEQDLLRAKDAAEAASRAKSEFLASMSHELRTPLNAIIGFSQIFGLDPDLSEESREHAKEIETAGNHLLALVNGLIDLARVESGQMELSLEAVQLGKVLAEALSMIAPIAAKQEIALTGEFEAQAHMTVHADFVRLRQVIINLLSNAIKYNRPRGSVRLVCEARPQGRMRVSVMDTGPGIPADKQSRIFNAFDRLGAERSAIEGTGIGLVLTRRMVEAMGGEIGFDSVEGQGSTFWVELPLLGQIADVQQPPVPGSGQAVSAQAPTTIKPVVLYVEDNPVNLRLMKQIFTRRPDLELRDAHTAEIGIDLARAEPPALILMDINLPGMNGYEALEVLRADPKTAHIPVVAVTANAMKGDEERGRESGFDDYVAKPLNVANFVEMLDRLLGR